MLTWRAPRAAYAMVNVPSAFRVTVAEVNGICPWCWWVTWCPPTSWADAGAAVRPALRATAQARPVAALINFTVALDAPQSSGGRPSDHGQVNRYLLTRSRCGPGTWGRRSAAFAAAAPRRRAAA